jgi:hypothetical protein
MIKAESGKKAMSRAPSPSWETTVIVLVIRGLRA